MNLPAARKRARGANGETPRAPDLFSVMARFVIYWGKREDCELIRATLAEGVCAEASEVERWQILPATGGQNEWQLVAYGLIGRRDIDCLMAFAEGVAAGAARMTTHVRPLIDALYAILRADHENQIPNDLFQRARAALYKGKEALA